MTAAIMRRLPPLGFDRRDAAMLLNIFKMNLADRFLGSSLGLTWAILGPLMLMGIFCFVFTFVFPGRLPGQEGALPFVIWLISGYAPWLGLSEGLNSSTSSVVANTGVIKNIAFKSEILPVVGAMMGLVPMGVGFVVLVLLSLIGGLGLGPAVVVIPFVVFLQVVFVSGLGFFLAALNVFVRDTALALPNVLTALLFASPIFYPLQAYPEFIRPVLSLNPFYVIAELYRMPLLHGTLPSLWMILYMTVLSTVLFAAGLRWFRRLKPFFDVKL